MELVDCFDDLAARFLLNLPYSETSSLPRFCFQIEEAQWYYEDFIRPMAAAAGQQLPNLSLRQFSLLMFQHCPLWNAYDDADLAAAYDLFLEYKVRVPVRGAILLDEKMEKVVLVKGYKKGANWSFPRGKINIDEDDLDCAIREVYEETGYNIRAAGLVSQPESNAKYIDITMREQHMRMFVFRGVPLDTHFEPQTRKEISKVQFWNLRDLPGYRKKHKDTEHDPSQDVHQANKFYMVAPFLGPLKKWIGQQRRGSGYVSTDANFNDTNMPAGEETDDGLMYHIPEVSNEEKSEALKKLLSIGAFAKEDLSPTNLNIHTVNHAAAAAEQTSQNLYRASQSDQQKAALLHILQEPQQHSDTTQAFRQPQTSTHEPQQHHVPYALSNNPVAPNTIRPAIDPNGLAPPKKMLLQLLSSPKAPSQVSAGDIAPQAPQPTAHAAKLLDLLNSPPALSAVPAAVDHSTPAVDAASLGQPVGQATKARQPQQRKSTLNEFTRTLRSKAKKSPVRHVTDLKIEHPALPTATSETTSRGSVHTKDTNVTTRVGRESGTNTAAKDLLTPTSIATNGRQRATKSRSSELVASPTRQGGSLAKTRQKSSKADVAPSPTFTILTRPGTQRDRALTGSGGSTQPTSGTAGTGQNDRPSSHQNSATASSSQQPDKLLALLGGSKPKSTTATSAEKSQAMDNTKAGQQDHLLRLFQKSPSRTLPADPIDGSTKPTPDQKSSAPVFRELSSPSSQDLAVPSAPVLQPEQRPSKLATTPQHSLLDLFKNGTSHKDSPETPISPFKLGSPEILRRPQQFAAPQTQPQGESDLTKESKPHSVSTPAESRGFLLDYLNGVVQKEGHRGGP